ncbi:DUF4230 domain-containing protein [Neolewinella agarilytica]|uniref:DUF4230 domain-containing protein n=1 Tax=Neolewinella agarilytica TaxID=478744 RepID=A0A1H9BM62_9BACT|nr:DUF4230 domain-containing protein [Neolewinella agarilytica]SEP89488.1 Protein of unknown function [Neolewinella agarilytica]
MKKLSTTLIAVVIAFLLGMAAFWGFSRDRSPELSTEEQSTILLQQVRKVMKLVTVEGDIAEIFDSKQTKTYTLYLPLPTPIAFVKEAAVEVSGKVLVGYDLEEVRLDIDEESRTLRISNLPEPEVLAIDHQVKFKHVKESWWNVFSSDDYSKLNERAKARLHDKALESHLVEEARQQGNGLIETIELLAKASGFTVEVEGREKERIVEGEN